MFNEDFYLPLNLPLCSVHLEADPTNLECRFPGILSENFSDTSVADPDPHSDPLVTSTDPVPDPVIIKQKQKEKP
jgi:hypothetical protein